MTDVCPFAMVRIVRQAPEFERAQIGGERQDKLDSPLVLGTKLDIEIL